MAALMTASPCVVEGASGKTGVVEASASALTAGMGVAAVPASACIRSEMLAGRGTGFSVSRKSLGASGGAAWPSSAKAGGADKSASVARGASRDTSVAAGAGCGRAGITGAGCAGLAGMPVSSAGMSSPGSVACYASRGGAPSSATGATKRSTEKLKLAGAAGGGAANRLAFSSAPSAVPGAISRLAAKSRPRPAELTVPGIASCGGPGWKSQKSGSMEKVILPSTVIYINHTTTMPRKICVNRIRRECS